MGAVWRAEDPSAGAWAVAIQKSAVRAGHGPRRKKILRKRSTAKRGLLAEVTQHPLRRY